MEDVIAWVKALRIYIEATEECGYWYVNTIDSPDVIGRGWSINEALDDLIDSWRKSLAILAIHSVPPSGALMPLFMKVLISSDEELRECCDLVQASK